MKTKNTLHITNRKDWREWLKANRDREKEIWLIYYKKHTGKQRISYDDAVEEAICFGWIDSIVKRIDDEKYMQKFTPRKKGSNWSDSNRKRVRKMIDEGCMTRAGLATLPDTLDIGVHQARTKQKKGRPTVPDDLMAALKANELTWKNFDAFPDGYKRLCIAWISDAKKKETRERRLEEVVMLAAQNRRIGLK
jgi:uncharacterized protein YdeI (YjbR/CyaY-like superfamily)